MVVGSVLPSKGWISNSMMRVSELLAVFGGGGILRFLI